MLRCGSGVVAHVYLLPGVTNSDIMQQSGLVEVHEGTWGEGGHQVILMTLWGIIELHEKTYQQY